MRLEELKSGAWEVLPRPVLEPSSVGWDSHSSMTPVVFENAGMGLEQGQKYGMFYIGIGNGASAWGVGYASSDDMLNWRRHGKNPMLLQEEGSGFQLDAPCLVRSGTGYFLICEEKRVNGGFGDSVRRRLGPGMKTVLRAARRSMGFEKPTVVNHASGRYFVSFSSTDALNWKRTSKRTIFKSGAQEAFDGRGVFSPQIYRFDGEYYLFYGGTDGMRAYTGLAKSPDMVSGWKRASIKPVLSPGKRGEFDEVNALIVSVMKMDDCYCAFYEGEDAKRRYSIGIAWSHDLFNWVKWGKNPIIMPGKYKYCEHMVCGPRVVSGKDGLFLFFNAHGKDMRGACGLAVFRRNG